MLTERGAWSSARGVGTFDLLCPSYFVRHNTTSMDGGRLQVASCKLGDAAPSMVKRNKFGIAEEKQRTFVASEFSFLNGRGKQRNRVGLECRRDFLTAVINRAFSECLLTTVSNCY